MTWVAGADGCRGGWVVALRRRGSRDIVIRFVRAISEILRWEEKPEILGIDMPIGLLDRAAPGGRDCDRRARALLGEPRARSVFSPPVRAALRATSYEEALRLNRKGCIDGPGISRQCFGILPKIREVDELMSPSLQDRIFEVHPELTFYELNAGAPVIESKKSPAGRSERVRLLKRAWGRTLAPVLETTRAMASRDDVIDALAVSWTAERILSGRFTRVPFDPPRDSRGLRMEIVR